MASVGPKIPLSTLNKRKRDGKDGDSGSDSNSGSDSDSDIGPAPPKEPGESAPKKTRLIGPSLPPTSHTESTPANEESDSSSSDDDDFGPSLPAINTTSAKANAGTDNVSRPKESGDSTGGLKRDDWMLVPPSGGDWTARVDPTKLKNRRFNTGKGAKGPSSSSGGASDSWHETPQEKQARLQREIMGIKADPGGPSPSTQASKSTVDRDTANRLEAYSKSRGPSLYDAHQKDQTVEKDDDPSARAFDREKDIGGGLQINATQRRDMMKRASDFSTRFSSAKYL